MSHRSRRHRSVKSSESGNEQSFFQAKKFDVQSQNDENAKKQPEASPVDNYEREAEAKPQDIQRLSTPKEDEKPGGTGTNEERMKNDKNIQE
ncbi:MAG: hypothetical protein JNK79_00400 [Chitinophagaceae bacterium]|nr:hypothetical protein [Chitinophagaceae bacterium]